MLHRDQLIECVEHVGQVAGSKCCIDVMSPCVNNTPFCGRNMLLRQGPQGCDPLRAGSLLSKYMKSME